MDGRLWTIINRQAVVMTDVFVFLLNIVCGYVISDDQTLASSLIKPVYW